MDGGLDGGMDGEMNGEMNGGWPQGGRWVDGIKKFGTGIIVLWVIDPVR